MESARCVCFALGDMNVVRSDDHWIDLRRIEVVPSPDSVAQDFERKVKRSMEFEQMGYTRKQGGDGVPNLLSRIDHAYTRISPSDLDGVSITADTIGDIFGTQNPSNHLPVSVRIFRRRRRHASLQVPLSVAVCRSAEFQEVVVGFMPSALQAERPFHRIEAARSVFRRAATEAAAKMAASRTILCSVSASVALRVVRAALTGDQRAVRRAASEDSVCELAWMGDASASPTMPGPSTMLERSLCPSRRTHSASQGPPRRRSRRGRESQAHGLEDAIGA